MKSNIIWFSKSNIHQLLQLILYKEPTNIFYWNFINYFSSPLFIGFNICQFFFFFHIWEMFLLREKAEKKVTNIFTKNFCSYKYNLLTWKGVYIVWEILKKNNTWIWNVFSKKKKKENMSFDFWYIIIEIWLKISEETDLVEVLLKVQLIFDFQLIKRKLKYKIPLTNIFFTFLFFFFNIYFKQRIIR